LKLRTVFLVLAGLLISIIPAAAQNDIYDNGPTNGTTDGWTINSGFAVSDSFTLNGGATGIGGLNFAAWILPGDTMEAAEVSITSSEFGGTTYFDQTVSFTQSGCVANQLGFNVCTESGSFNGPNLNSGTYWLNLQNATVSGSGDPVYWDENSGPSSASESSLGTIPSESFTLLGCEHCTTTTTTTSTTGSTPEPTTFLLFGSGLLGTCAWLRRRLF
jgi:hypothetical protein